MNPDRTTKGLLSFTDRGSGTPLLLIHGLMVSGEMFEPVIDRFTATHRVIVPDLRGHGKSRGLGPPYAPAQLASDLSNVLDHLKIESTAVLGYSQGGAIAQQFALDHPAQCSRLVLACTYAFNMATLREKLEGNLVPILIHLVGMEKFARFVVSHGAKEMGKERGEWLASLMASQNQSLMLSAWKQAMEFDSRSRLAEIRCPTLIIAGSADNAVPMHHANTLHHGIAGSRLGVVEGATHALIWTHPEEFANLAQEFLRI